MRAKLALPNLPKVPTGYSPRLLMKPQGMRTKNPFAYMSGSIAATQQRRRRLQPMVSAGFPSFPSF